MASVTVITALTMAARDRRSGTMPTMLIVPGSPGSSRGRAGSSGAAAHVGTVTPDRHVDPRRRRPRHATPAHVDRRQHPDTRAREPALERELGQMRLGVEPRVGVGYLGVEHPVAPTDAPAERRRGGHQARRLGKAPHEQRQARPRLAVLEELGSTAVHGRERRTGHGQNSIPLRALMPRS